MRSNESAREANLVQQPGSLRRTLRAAMTSCARVGGLALPSATRERKHLIKGNDGELSLGGGSRSSSNAVSTELIYAWRFSTPQHLEMESCSFILILPRG